MTPIEILNCNTFNTPDGGEFPLEYKGDFTRKKYNTEQNSVRQQLFDNTSDYLKSQWNSLYNKINSPEV